MAKQELRGERNWYAIHTYAGYENAVMRNREIMGATDPAKAAPGTIRKEFGDSMGENAAHGSDSPESAKRELALFFAQNEFVNK